MRIKSKASKKTRGIRVSSKVPKIEFDPEATNIGVCRRFPPSPEFSFPNTSSTTFCGEFLPREVIKEEVGAPHPKKGRWG